MEVIEERKGKEENETEETPAADFFMGIIPHRLLRTLYFGMINRMK